MWNLILSTIFSFFHEKNVKINQTVNLQQESDTTVLANDRKTFSSCLCDVNLTELIFFMMFHDFWWFLILFNLDFYMSINKSHEKKLLFLFSIFGADYNGLFNFLKNVKILKKWLHFQWVFVLHVCMLAKWKILHFFNFQRTFWKIKSAKVYVNVSSLCTQSLGLITRFPEMAWYPLHNVENVTCGNF